MLWEYKQISEYNLERLQAGYNMRANLNALGAEGWELVAVHLSSGNIGARPVYIFKRPKEAVDV